MNKAILIGNLTKDPILNKTASGLSFCRFTVAINSFADRPADFVPIVAWEKVADNCMKFLKKGSKVAVDGTLRSNSYEDQNGERKFTLDVTASRVEFLSTTPVREDNPHPTEFSEVTAINDNLGF